MLSLLLLKNDPKAGSKRDEPNPPARVFICFRSEDTEQLVGRFRDYLDRDFKVGQYFSDEDIVSGQKWLKRLEAEVGRATVVLCFIGSRWLARTAGESRPRLFEADDVLRQEIEWSLRKRKARSSIVIPVLVDGAKLPRKDEIPESIHGLLAIQAFPLRSRSWAEDYQAIRAELLARAVRPNLRHRLKPSSILAATRALPGRITRASRRWRERAASRREAKAAEDRAREARRTSAAFGKPKTLNEPSFGTIVFIGLIILVIVSVVRSSTDTYSIRGVQRDFGQGEALLPMPRSGAAWSPVSVSLAEYFAANSPQAPEAMRDARGRPLPVEPVPAFPVWHRPPGELAVEDEELVRLPEALLRSGTPEKSTVERTLFLDQPGFEMAHLEIDVSAGWVNSLLGRDPWQKKFWPEDEEGRADWELDGRRSWVPSRLRLDGHEAEFWRHGSSPRLWGHRMPRSRRLLVIDAGVGDEPSRRDRQARALAIRMLDRGLVEAALLGADWAAGRSVCEEMSMNECLYVLETSQGTPGTGIGHELKVLADDLMPLIDSLDHTDVPELAGLVEWATRLVAIKGDFELHPVVDLEFVALPGGSFSMGSPSPGEGPRHEVTLSPYLMQRYEVSRDLWIAVMGSAPKQQGNPFPIWGRGPEPALGISYHEALEFCGRFRELSGWPVHLPTEAQWEFACRAGLDAEAASDGSKLEERARIQSDQCLPVGSRSPNAWGLHDLQGNVWEWCRDWFAPAYEVATAAATRDPIGPEEGEERVRRGGGYDSAPTAARPTFRSHLPPKTVRLDTGFRMIMRLGTGR